MKNILHLPGSAACNGEREGMCVCACMYIATHTHTYADMRTQAGGHAVTCCLLLQEQRMLRNLRIDP